MYNKEGRIQLETTAHIQNRLDTNIQFYNTDIGTADLVFNITRNGSPLLVSSENADVFLILKNGKNYIVDNVEPIDPMNGRLKYTIPNEFLGLTGKVNGQLYIAVHGKEDIVTEVEFSFKIADSLINTIPAVDKLNEMRTFQEFRESIMTTINEINEELANGKDYVSQMEGTKASGMKALNDRTTQVLKEIEDMSSDFANQFGQLKDHYVNEIDDKGNQIKADIEQLNQYDTSNWQKYKMTNDDGKTPSIVFGGDLEKLRALKTGFYYGTSIPIGTSYSNEWSSSTAGFIEVIEKDTDTVKIIIFKPYNSSQEFIMRYYNEWTGWERINPDLRRKCLGTIGAGSSKYNSVLEIPAGLYECSIPADAFTVDAPLDPNGSGYIAQIDVTEGSAGKRKQFKLIASSSNNEYRGTVHTSNASSPDGQFMGWKKVQNEEEYNALFDDTGWIDWNTMNGATKRETDNPNALQCQRRIRTVNGVKVAHLRVNVNNVVTQTTFGSIPADMVPKVQNFYIRTPVSMNPAVLFVDIDGTLKFYCNLNDTSKWLPGHYIYGEFSWIIDDIGGGQ